MNMNRKRARTVSPKVGSLIWEWDANNMSCYRIKKVSCLIDMLNTRSEVTKHLISIDAISGETSPN